MRSIAILFELDREWIGGSYYIRNLVSALAMLPKSDRPAITIICAKPESFVFIRDTGYRPLNWLVLSQYAEHPDDYPFDLIFPHPDHGQEWRTLSWIPDFQELHLPQYFTSEEIANRRHHHRLRFLTSGLVVSSEDVAADVTRFYSGECENVAVVHFATFDTIDKSRLPHVRARYGLTSPYVMCANQVWVHKNHIVVLKAIALLKQRGIVVDLCFTGSESDYRIRNYADFLKTLAHGWGVADQVHFLGFLPREDQLALMAGAQYVVQPSLFEGWSTVIEDAKAMGQFVVASDLDVHKEQLKRNCRFFPRHDPLALAEIMAEFTASPPVVDEPLDYFEARRDFGRDFLAAVERFRPASRLDNRTWPISGADLAQISADNVTRLLGEPWVVTDDVDPNDPANGRQPTHDLAYYFMAVGEYAHVAVSRVNTREQVLLQRNGRHFSIEFNVAEFPDRNDFNPLFIEGSETGVVRIYIGNEANDAGIRYSGLSATAKALLVSVLHQGVDGLYVYGDSVGDFSRPILERCLAEVRSLTA